MTPTTSPRRTFRLAQRNVAVVWGGAMMVQMAVVGFVWPDRADAAISVAIASLAIAIASLESGLRLVSAGHSDSGSLAGQTAEAFLGAISAGTLIRLVGTIALLIWCRYHFEPLLGFLAFNVIGWYVVLTVTEVVSIVRRLENDTKSGPSDNLPLASKDTLNDTSAREANSPDSRCRKKELACTSQPFILNPFKPS